MRTDTPNIIIDTTENKDEEDDEVTAFPGDIIPRPPENESGDLTELTSETTAAHLDETVLRAEASESSKGGGKPCVESAAAYESEHTTSTGASSSAPIDTAGSDPPVFVPDKHTPKVVEEAKALLSMRKPYLLDGRFEVLCPGSPEETRVKRNKDSARIPGFMPALWIKAGTCTPAIKKYLHEMLKDDLRAANSWSHTSTVPAAPAPVSRSTNHRRIVEFCTSEDSRIGSSRNFVDSNCEVVRITEKHDGTTRVGKRMLNKVCNSDVRTLLWCSIPCVGGCRYNVDINQHKSPEAAERLRQQRALYKQLWDTFATAARIVRRNGGNICIEWPKSCTYWLDETVLSFMSELGLKKAEIHGCSVGLAHSDGRPVNKPWFVATDDPTIFSALNMCRCPGCKEHAPCENKLCKTTEGYTDVMANIVHAAWKESSILAAKHADSRKGGDPPPDVSNPGNWERVPAMPIRRRAYSHRPHVGSSIRADLAVARPVGKAEIVKEKAARASLDGEWTKLIAKKAWDMSNPRPKHEVINDARKNGFKAHFGRLFMLCVQKGSELCYGHPDQKYKGRLVFQGNNVQDELRDWAVFNELSSSAAPIEGAKIVDLFGLQPGNIIQTADADQAYIQAKIKDYTLEKEAEEGGKRRQVYCETWITLPDDYVPEEWRKRGIVNPVVRLLQALYGHPDAGGFWEQHLTKHLLAVGFKIAH